MPDANGRIRGTGWSRASEAAFDRLANAASPRPAVGDYVRIEGYRAAGLVRRVDDTYVYVTPENGLLDRPPLRWARAHLLWPVPHEPPDEVDSWLADREAAEDDGWEADAQAARDGYNPAR